MVYLSYKQQSWTLHVNSSRDFIEGQVFIVDRLQKKYIRELLRVIYGSLKVLHPLKEIINSYILSVFWGVFRLPFILLSRIYCSNVIWSCTKSDNVRSQREVFYPYWLFFFPSRQNGMVVYKGLRLWVLTRLFSLLILSTHYVTPWPSHIGGRKRGGTLSTWPT